MENQTVRQPDQSAAGNIRQTGHWSPADCRHRACRDQAGAGPDLTNKRPTANRIRKHLEGAINWAIAEGHRTDESNPAEVKRLQFSLSFAERRVTHYPSLPYSEAPSFLAELRKQDGVKARALEFVMLTAVRVADICGGGKARGADAVN
jgi:integrase